MKIACLENGRQDHIKAYQNLKDRLAATMTIVNDQKELIEEKDLNISCLENERKDPLKEVIVSPPPSKITKLEAEINVTGNLENHLDVSEATSESCSIPSKKFRSQGMNTLFDAPRLDESKHVIEKDVVGSILWFSIKSGCGYIKLNNSQETLFVHRTSYRYLRPGELVTFDIASTASGKKVSNLSILQGQDPFKGTPYAENCGL